MQLIDLSKQSAEEIVKQKYMSTDLSVSKNKRYLQGSFNKKKYVLDTYEDNRKLLLESRPGKLLYSIKEAATILGVSYEFIRKHILTGQILTKNFGERKFIHLNEISRLITEGIIN